MTKEKIIKEAKANPEHILCLFTKDNFKIAKEFWGEEITWIKPNQQQRQILYQQQKQILLAYGKLLPDWQYHLQQMVLEKEPLKYLEKFS